MYFDPLTSWLVALIADGIVIAGEKSTRRESLEDADRKRAEQRNTLLNHDIRRVKERFGETSPEWALEQIQIRIRATETAFTHSGKPTKIILDLDNYDYIIALLEACAKNALNSAEEVSCNPGVANKYRAKAETYNNLAATAKRKKEDRNKEIEAARIRVEEDREAGEIAVKIFLFIGFLIVSAITLIIC